MRTLKKTQIVFLAIFSIALAMGIYLRVDGIAEIGFAGDEETTTLAAMGISENGIPHFPSGMPYYRSLPHTYLLHLIFTNFGVGEFQARIPSVLLGIGFILLCVYLAYSIYPNFYFVMVVGSLASLGCYQIEISRTARMYGPFVFFHTLYLLFAFRYFKFSKVRDILLSLFFFAISISFSELGVFGILFLTLQFFFKKSRKDRIWIFMTSLVSGIVWFFFYRLSNYGFSTFRTVDVSLEQTNQASFFPDLPMLNFKIFLLNVIIFAILSSFLFRYDRKVYSYLTIPIFLFFMLGFIHLAWILFLLIILIDSRIGLREIIVKAFGFFCTMAYLLNNFFVLGSIKESIKHTFAFPNLVEIYFLSTFPIFLIGLFSLYFYSNYRRNLLLKLIFFGSLISLVVISFFKFYFNYRYISFLIPIMMVVYAFLLVEIFEFFRKKTFRTVLIALASFLIFIEISPINYFTSYFNTNYGSLSFPNNYGRPDHKGAAQYVKKHLEKSDVVVSVDALQTKYYLGRVDYWLRKYSDLQHFLYLDKSGEVRDVYTDSKPVRSLEELKGLIQSSGRVWLIDSGETFVHPSIKMKYDLRKYYLPSPILDFLTHSESNIVYKGRDGCTNVYEFISSGL